MKITPHQYAAALYEALSDTKPADRDKVLDNFVEVLTENGHLGILPEIEAAFVKHEQQARGEIPVTVATAREGSAEKQIMDSLNDLVGANATVTKQLDESLIGGVLIETEDTRIDASVKGQLKKLKKSLID